MKTFTKDELKEILEKHKKWINNEKGGKRAYLREADLTGASLRGADLRGASLRGADLRGADLTEADLTEADLRGADLTEADLTEAFLRGAFLRGADLTEADLTEADLRGADLRGADGINFPMTCPDTGSFTAWKKASGLIVKLKIPEDARRSSATGRKCRCDKAKVISIENIDGTPAEVTSVSSSYDSNFIYTVGETVEEPDFCPNRWEECAAGIHFFINRSEAEKY